tara:strand:- start:948 stop:1250 length:303 start_codon:yes stop_codon:yes gene_type:complete
MFNKREKRGGKTLANKKYKKHKNRVKIKPENMICILDDLFRHYYDLSLSYNNRNKKTKREIIEPVKNQKWNGPTKWSNIGEKISKYGLELRTGGYGLLTK